MSDNNNSNTIIARTQDYKIIYSDIFSFRPSPGDCHLTFAVRGTVQTNEGMRDAAIEQITIAMTTSAAKLLAINLRRIVGVVEAENGPISFVQSGVISDALLQQFGSQLRSNQLANQGMATFDVSPYSVKLQ